MYNRKQKEYSIYEQNPGQLEAHVICDYCNGADTLFSTRAGKLKDKGVENVHMTSCMANCKLGNTEILAKILADAGLNVVAFQGVDF